MQGLFVLYVLLVYHCLILKSRIHGISQPALSPPFLSSALSWGSKLPFPSKKSGASQEDPKTERDFMTLNRAAVQAGLITAPENYQFRATHDVRRKVKSEEGRSKLPRRLAPTMVYGISTRSVSQIHNFSRKNKYAHGIARCG